MSYLLNCSLPQLGRWSQLEINLKISSKVRLQCIYSYIFFIKLQVYHRSENFQWNKIECVYHKENLKVRLNYYVFATINDMIEVNKKKLKS